MGLFDSIGASINARRQAQMVQEMKNSIEKFVQIGLPNAETFIERIETANEAGLDQVKSLHQREFQEFRKLAPEAEKRFQQARKKAAEEAQWQKDLARYQKRADECLSILNDPSASIICKAAWGLRNLNYSHKTTIIEQVLQISKPKMQYGRTDAVSMLGNMVTGVQQGVITAKIGSIASLMDDILVARPVAGFSEPEKRLLQGLIHAYRLGDLKEEAFEEFWFGFAWSAERGGAGLAYEPKPDGSQPKYAAEAIECVRWYLHNRFFADYDQFLAKVKQHVVAGAQVGSDELKRKLHNLLDQGNRWLADDELDQTMFNTMPERGLLLGGLGEKLITFEGAPSVLTIAPPGSGKTQAQVIPSLLFYQGSVVVLDVKGEIFEATAGKRSQMGQRIIRWNALDSTGTHRYDPLKEVRRDPDDLWEDCQEMAVRLLPDKPGEKDPFWRTEARNLVTMHLADMLLSAPENERNMADLVGRLLAGPESISVRCENELQALAQHYHLPALRNRANALLGMIVDSPKMYQSVVSQAASELAIFEGGRVSRALSGSDWTPQDLRREPTTVYISLPDKKVEAFGPLLRLIFAQHFAGLRDNVNNDGLPITFFMDEAAAFGNFPELLSLLDRGRGYGLRAWLFFQNLGQIEKVYSNPSSITGNVAVRCYMNPQGETAKALSDELGIVRNVVTGTEEPMARPESLSGPNYSDDVIILGQGTLPIRADKVMAHKYLKDHMLPPPQLFDGEAGPPSPTHA